MPVAQYKPTATVQPVNIPKIEGVENTSMVVDAKYTPLTSLIKHVEGLPYTVNYYAQVLSKDSAVTGQDHSTMGQYQQYKRIDRLVIKMTQALAPDQDAVNKTFNVRGEGLINNVVRPNVGDMFVADVGDGRGGVFEITTSERNTIMQDSVYRVGFSLMYFETDPRRQDLEAKVVQHYHYLEDFVQSGNNPLVTTNEYNALMELSAWYGRLVGYYYDWFYSREFTSFIVPGQMLPTYDHFLTKFVTSLLSTGDHHLVVRTKMFNVNDDDYLTQPQLYRALIERDHTMLTIANRVMGKTHVSNFIRDPFLEGIRYSGLHNVVYPVESYTTPADYGLGRNSRLKSTTMMPFDNPSGLSGNLNNKVTTGNVEPQPAFPKIYNVLDDQFYVLSRAFYEQDGQKSLLEVLTENYLQNEPNDPTLVLTLVRDSQKWGALERFYYIPILLLLIKTLVKEI